MNRYKVKSTNILHNGRVYHEGSTIELNEAQALQLENYLELLEVLTKAAPAPKSTPKPKPAVEKQETKPVDKIENKQDQQNNTKDPENNSENNKNNTQNFVPPNMRRE